MRLIDIEAPCKIEIELDGEKCHATIIAHTVDAVPVKRGEWEYIGGYGYQYRCSKCVMCAEHKTRYCPNCGAKMDGRKVDDLP